jgi:hypothetical protein
MSVGGRLFTLQKKPHFLVLAIKVTQPDGTVKDLKRPQKPHLRFFKMQNFRLVSYGNPRINAD